MQRHFNYPAKLTKQKEGGYLVQFPDLPEAITQGESIEDGLIQAADCLEEAIANRIEMNMPIPIPSKLKRQQYLVSLHALLAAKTALYLTMQEKKLTKVSLARKLHCDEKEIRRLLDPHFSSKLPRIEHALQSLGQRLNIVLSSL